MQISWVFSDIYVLQGLTLSIITELDGPKAGLSHPEVITRFSAVSNKSPSELNGKLVNFSTGLSPPKTKDARSMTGVVRVT